MSEIEEKLEVIEGWLIAGGQKICRISPDKDLVFAYKSKRKATQRGSSEFRIKVSDLVQLLDSLAIDVTAKET